jgi:membrane protein implicated in regulation of membrane protease activity
MRSIFRGEMTGMRLGIASFVLLVIAGVLLFINVWAGLGAFVASVIVQTMARKRFTRDELPARRVPR